MDLLGPFNPTVRIYLDCFVFMKMCEIQRHGKCVKGGDIVYVVQVYVNMLI